MARVGPDNAGDFVNIRSFAPLDGDRNEEPTRPKFLLEPLAAIRPDLVGFWLIKELLPARGLKVLYGLPGCGKSFVAVSAALHVAAGLEWAGRKVKQTGVIYIAAEGRTGFRKRVFAAKLEYGIPDNTPFALITVKPDLGASPGDRETLIQNIRAQCAVLKFKPGLIVIDTLARSIEGADESSAKDMGVFVSNADQIGEELDAMVMVVHHSGKTQERGMRGSSALHGAADAEWEVVSDEAGRSVKVAKQKDGEDGLKFMFRLRKIEVGRDEDDDPVTTCVVEILNTPKHSSAADLKLRKRLAGQKAEFVKAVTMAIAEAGEYVPASSHVPYQTKGVKKQVLARYADQLGFSDGMTAEVRKATLNRHVRTLCGDGHLAQWGEWIWLAK